MNDVSFISLNGSLHKSDEASVSPVNRGMMYGDGCFETLKSYRGMFLGWDSHFKRLTEGLSYLELESPVNSSKLKKEVLDVLGVNNLLSENAVVRIQFWREGRRGYKSSSHESSRMIQVSSYVPAKEPLQLLTSKTRSIPSESLERKYKLTNSLNYIKAAQEAARRQKDDALMLTVEGIVSETTIANLFWMKDGLLFTPSKGCDLLPGITRNMVLSILKENDIDVEVGEFAPESFYEADSAFCTNSLIEIREVSSVDDYHFKTGLQPILEIRDLFQTFKDDKLES